MARAERAEPTADVARLSGQVGEDVEALRPVAGEEEGRLAPTAGRRMDHRVGEVERSLVGRRE